MSFSAMTADRFCAEQGRKRGRGQKYSNKKVKTEDGLTFDSRAEYRHWQHLTMLQRAGKILDLERQVAFVLAPAVKLSGRTKPALRYVADFVYTEADTGERVVADVKGASTDVWRIKKHLMMSVHGIQVVEIRA